MRRASDVASLAALNRRARACALQYLTSAGAAAWVARFTHAVDIGILARVIELSGEATGGCWCVCGVAGRAESIVAREPRVILILGDRADEARAIDAYAGVVDALRRCEYVPRGGASEPDSHVAAAAERRRRYTAWIHRPVVEGMAQNRSLFDLRPAPRTPR